MQVRHFADMADRKLIIALISMNSTIAELIWYIFPNHVPKAINANSQCQDLTGAGLSLVSQTK